MATCAATLPVYVASGTSGNASNYSVNVIVPALGDPTACDYGVLLSSVEYSDFLSNISNFGWDSAAFDMAVEGGLMFFAVGLGIGLLISVVRKFRI